MNEIISNVLDVVARYHLDWVLLASAVGLFLVDVFFRTDWPAHLAYICAAAAVFCWLPLAAIPSLVVAVGLWAILALLHRFCWGRWIENAPPPKPEPTIDEPVS